MIVDPSGDLYFTDGRNNRIRRIDSSGNISAIAGNGSAGFSGDGASPLSASFNGAFGIALDPLGNIDIADTLNNRIRQISHYAFAAPAFSQAGVVNAAIDAPGLTSGGLATLSLEPGLATRMGLS